MKGFYFWKSSQVSVNVGVLDDCNYWCSLFLIINPSSHSLYNCASMFVCYSRSSLPAPMFSRNDFSIWSILRNCIGMVRLLDTSWVCFIRRTFTVSLWLPRPLLMSFLGTLQDYNAGDFQRATQLLAASDRVHGAHLPHPPGQHFLRLY